MKAHFEDDGGRWVVEGAEFYPKAEETFDVPDATFAYWMEVQARFDGMQNEITRLVHERNHNEDHGVSDLGSVTAPERG